MSKTFLRQLRTSLFLTFIVSLLVWAEARAEESVAMATPTLEAENQDDDSGWKSYLGMENLLFSDVGGDFYSIGEFSIRYMGSYYAKDNPFVFDIGIGMVVFRNPHVFFDTAIRYRLPKGWQVGVRHRIYAWEKLYGLQVLKNLSKDISVGISAMASPETKSSYTGVDFQFRF